MRAISARLLTAGLTEGCGVKAILLMAVTAPRISTGESDLRNGTAISTIDSARAPAKSRERVRNVTITSLGPRARIRLSTESFVCSAVSVRATAGLAGPGRPAYSVIMGVVSAVEW